MKWLVVVVSLLHTVGVIEVAGGCGDHWEQLLVVLCCCDQYNFKLSSNVVGDIESLAKNPPEIQKKKC